MARVRVKVKDNLPKEAAMVDAQAETETTPSAESETHQVVEAVSVEQPADPYLNHSNAEAVHPKSITIMPKTIILGVVGLILITIIIILANKDNSDSKGQTPLTTTTQTTESQAATEAIQYHQEISKYVDVPSDQTPSLVAVSDPAKLAEKSPVLFKNAQKDDVVLFYLNADKTGKAILYRPSTKKLIAVVDGVNLNSSTTPGSTTPPNSSNGTTR